jgi:hypothetical protein
MFITNRYNNAIEPIRFTLPLLMKDAEFREQVRKLRAKGYKDWFILNCVTNIALNYRLEKKLGRSADPETLTKAMEKAMFEKENEGDLPVPPSIFNDEQVNIGEKLALIAVAKTWGLGTPRQTPNFDAYQKFLVDRYHLFDDDIPHDDHFAGV